MSIRQRIKVRGKFRYIERGKDGRFKDNTNINKSIRTDTRKKHAKRVKRGHGHECDLKRRRK